MRAPLSIANQGLLGSFTLAELNAGYPPQRYVNQTAFVDNGTGVIPYGYFVQSDGVSWKQQILVDPTTGALSAGGVIQIIPSALQSYFEQQLMAAGFVGNGIHDDCPSIQTAMNAVMSKNWFGNGVQNTGLRVYIPDGIIGLGSQLQIPTRMWVVGRGKRAASTFVALPTFAQGSATYNSMIKLGRETAVAGIVDPLVFDAGLAYCGISANGYAASNVVSNKIQEGSGLISCGLYGATTYGWYLPADNNADFFGTELEVYPNSGATSGIHILNAGGRVVLQSITTVGNTTLTNGVYSQGTLLEMLGLHCEISTNGIQASGGNVHGIGISGGATVTNLVLVDNTSNHQWHNLQKSLATNTYVDPSAGLTLQNASICSIGGPNYAQAFVWVKSGAGDVSGVTNINFTYGCYNEINTLTENTTVAVPTNALQGQEMICKFTQDGTGSRTVAWNAIFKNVITSSGTANQKACVKFFFDGTNWWPMGGTLTATGALAWSS